MNTPNNAAALLPCPFCGSMPKSGWQGTGVPGMEDCGYWGIDCCNAFAHAGSENDAASQWNRRAITKTSPHELLGVAYKEQGISGVVDFHRPATNTLRDAITSQPSGEEVTDEMVERGCAAAAAAVSIAWPTGNAKDNYRQRQVTRAMITAALSAMVPASSCDRLRVLSPAVDEVLRGVCMRMLTFENSEHVPNVMFQQLRAALAPKPEGGHG